MEAKSEQATNKYIKVIPSETFPTHALSLAYCIVCVIMINAHQIYIHIFNEH
jgi:hypothetical protein